MNHNKNRVLITGGAGFIGSAIIPELRKFGHDIYVVDNLSFGRRELIDIEDNKFFKEDIRNRSSLTDIIKKIAPEWVIHLAAIHFIPYCNEHPYEAASVLIEGTINVIDAVKAAGTAQKVLFASTAAVYPIYDKAITEEHELRPLDIYGLGKWTGERLMNEFYLETGIPVVNCRFFNAFGPNETNPHLIPEIQNQINAGKRTIKLGNLTPKRDFIHTFDMARAVRMLMEMESDKLEVFNLGRGIEYSVTEIVDAFERQLGEKITVEVEQSRVRKVERMHLLADISKLRTATGWEPEWGIDEGIKTLINVEH